MSSVGLICNDPTTVTTGDATSILRGILEGMGHTVTLRGPSESPASVAGAHRFLVWGPTNTTADGLIGSGYRDLAVPIVVCVNHATRVVRDGLALFGSASQGDNRNWSIYAEAAGNALAAGFTGTNVAWSGTTAEMRNYWVNGAGPTGTLKIANHNGDTTRPVAYAIPAGAALWDAASSTYVGGTGHGWRGAISCDLATFVGFRTAFWESLFKAQVTKADSEGSVTPVNTPPTSTYTASPGTSVQIGQVVTLSLTGSDAEGSVTYLHTLTSKPGGSAATLSGSTTTTATFTADVAGQYVATGRVTDAGGLQLTRTVTVTAFSTVPPDGVATVTRAALIDLRASTPGSGGSLTFSLSHVSGPNEPVTVLAPGYYQLPIPTTTVVKAWQVQEGAQTTSGTVTVDPLPTGTEQPAPVSPYRMARYYLTSSGEFVNGAGYSGVFSDPVPSPNLLTSPTLIP